jgi:energy-coupling factor transporter ATP-binding protein EcfA2
MYLSELTVENFKPYENASITLPETGMVFIAGPNNSGKSALLAAIDVVAGRGDNGAWTRTGAEQPARVVATFVLTEDDRRSIVLSGNQQRYKDEWLASHAFERLQLTFVAAARQMLCRTLALTGYDGGLRSVADLRVDGGGNRQLWLLEMQALLGQDPVQADWSPGQGISRGGGLVAIERCDEISPLWRRWASPLYHFSGVRTGTAAISASSEVVPVLAPNGSNLAQALLYQFTQKAPEWTAIQKVMAEVLPDVGEVVTPVSGSQVEVAVIDPFSGARRNIKDLGAGVEQVLMAAYVGATQPVGSVILIEEPETNLHAAAERELLRHLIDWAKDRLIILSTHSTVFLDQAASASATTLVVERKDGLSQVKQADTEFTSVLRAIGVRLSDVLSAEKLILVEGEIDAEILQAWFPGLVLTRRTAIVPLGGGDRAYQVEMIGSVFSAADQLGRQIVFLRDADHLSASNRQKLNNLGRVTILKRREMENYLLDPDAILAVLAAREAQPGVTVKRRFDSASMRTFIADSADTLKGMVVLKSVADELVPVRLIDRKTVKSIASRGGGLSELRKAVQEALPSADKLVSDVDCLWAETQGRIDSGWESHKTDVAPGTEILSAIWRAHGGSYDKRRDGQQIAAAMAAGPKEVREALTGFLSTSRRVPSE